MDSITFIQQHISASIETKQALLSSPGVNESIANAAKTTLDAYRQGHKIIIAGNGGSAADAQHIAAEFVSRFEFDRPGLPAMALTTDTSILTAIGNDYGFERLFSRQVEANGLPGDVFVGISTSGNSPNILSAFKTAKEFGLTTIGLAGVGGKIQEACDICISVPSSHTPRIQESHILIGHIICAYVEEGMFGEQYK
ncbi:Catalyzes the isomerization of sedoheptulose 7-phosphate in D-glycero-D-manno-heptose 7-phosphate (plasmid) [Vibrio sp. B1REV9]|uniref:D-sedoheptulose-7-phosphate isomerase n=1 Tax=Vibrio sp. B1REV9 TaxID=2751179 RepID=UPI001AECC2BA|nr:D-sedoheptulose 7-phosphate isomerase [Vibrio sp. B1REV9]CAE6957125.1 Catalyzes the isomerization of sedoheptulose 7-phosphate in D-glycero-D-manno-heptose 7-phosphate [Vibrio sp. B1REV9]